MRILEQMAMDEEEYLHSKGFGTQGRPIAAFRGTLGMSDAALKRAQKQHLKTLQDYDAERERLRGEYRALVKAGKLRPKGRMEKLMTTAQGHPDRQDVQAARRLLAKQGLWDDAMSRKADKRFEALRLSPKFKRALEAEVKRLMEELSPIEKLTEKARILAKYKTQARRKADRLMIDQIDAEMKKYKVPHFTDLVRVYQRQMAEKELKAAGLL